VPVAPSGGTRPAAPVQPAAPVAPAIPMRDAFSGPRNLEGEKIHTIFTPSDEAKKAELALLDTVISARRADNRSYPAGQNPYRIEYAIYNMTDRDVIGRLIDASRAGIEVQVLIDAGQISPEKPHNTVVKDLVAAGFSHAESQKGLSAEAKLKTQVVEIEMPGSGLFHFKSRYFTWPDPQTGQKQESLLTGSHNPQNSAHKNDESLHRIEDPALIKKYTDAYRALRDDKPIENSWDPNAGANVLFTSANTRGPKPVDKILELVDQERELIFLSVFSLRNLEASDGARLVDKLVAAQNRGVPVVVVTDRKQSDGVRDDGTPTAQDMDQTDDLLERAGIPVYEYTNPAGPRTAMHLKSGLFGLTDMKVVSDTGNWTQATMGTGGTSRGKNAESILFVDSKKYDGNRTGVTYLAEFLRVMRKYSDQNAGTNKPDVEKLIQKLQALPAFPKVKVDLEDVAAAHAGREVYVTGDHPALRGQGGAPGLKLDTEPGSAAFRARATVELPLMTRLEYKVTTRDAQGRVDAPSAPSILVVDPTLNGGTDAMKATAAVP
jgi:phosphatidylserine/phosphatidylglycerophosphate/cardiolipin synthase-like enzyme